MVKLNQANRIKWTRFTALLDSSRLLATPSPGPLVLYVIPGKVQPAEGTSGVTLTLLTPDTVPFMAALSPWSSVDEGARESESGRVRQLCL